MLNLQRVRKTKTKSITILENDSFIEGNHTQKISLNFQTITCFKQPFIPMDDMTLEQSLQVCTRKQNKDLEYE